MESPYVRLVEHWLVTNETAINEPYGLYLCQPDVAVVQIGSRITEAIFDKAIGALGRLGFVRWDAESRFVWVVNQAAHQLLENWQPMKTNDWRVLAARKWYAACQTNPFLGPFFDMYGPYLHLEQRREGKPLQRGFEAPRSTSVPALDLDLSGEGGVGGETAESIALKRRADVDIGLRTEFEAWWAICPVKVGKGAAWEEYQRQRPPFEQLMATTRAYLESEEWAPKSDGERAIPHPRTFLHQRRWEDTPTRLRPRAAGPTQGDDWRDACPHTPQCSTPRRCELRRMKEAG